jgi:hypothetical protein
MRVRPVEQDQLCSVRSQESRDGREPGSEHPLVVREKDQPCLVHVIRRASIIRRVKLLGGVLLMYI